MSASGYLAETYAMKTLYKEKMKRLDKEEATTYGIYNDKSKKSSSSGDGWYTKMFKKVHPISKKSHIDGENKTLSQIFT